MLEQFILAPRIAYFSMEIALRNEIPTYAGGLGVLAGDTMRSAADLALPMVAVSLVSRAGYFRQEIGPQGRQIERPASWDPERFARPLDAKIAVPIEGRVVWIGAWLYTLEGQMGGLQPVLLVVLPLYYGYAQEPGGWIKVMKGTISKNASYFNSHRMMRRYATEAYLR